MLTKTDEPELSPFWKREDNFNFICYSIKDPYSLVRIVHHKMVDNKELTMKHMNKLADWLSRLHTSFREGNMSKTLQELPDYYRAVDTKVGQSKAISNTILD